MNFTRLNEASQQLEPFQVPGDELFVTLSIRHRFGDAYVLTHKETVTLPLDEFVALVYERSVIQQAADEKPKQRKKAVAA